MKTDVKNKEGKVIYSFDQQNSKLNIYDVNGSLFCCIDHDGRKLMVKDKNDKVLSELESKIEKTPVV